ncbi:hypothetical protein RYX36_035315 [Vicia faba]
MCRGGRMFAPTWIWRRWHRKINVNQKRYAVVSAIAASVVPSLVLARGHRIEAVPEFPLVVGDSAEGMEKTKEAIKVLKRIGAFPDAEKTKDSHGIRPGKGLLTRKRVQYVVRPIKKDLKRATLKKNPLKNLNVMLRLNPYAKTAKRMALLAEAERLKSKKEMLRSLWRVLWLDPPRFPRWKEKDAEKVDEDDLSRRLAELKARG